MPSATACAIALQQLVVRRCGLRISLPRCLFTGKGLRNAAALFLPEDGSFTKATAEDLEFMRDWPIEKRIKHSARSTLGRESGYRSSYRQDQCSTPRHPRRSNRYSVGSRGGGTKRSIDRHPRTASTGKSQVILSLMISAVMTGKSVLFSAKNHQAITEVEERLKEIVPQLASFDTGKRCRR